MGSLTVAAVLKGSVPVVSIDPVLWGFPVHQGKDVEWLHIFRAVMTIYP
jgi:hypothetical protein